MSKQSKIVIAAWIITVIAALVLVVLCGVAGYPQDKQTLAENVNAVNLVFESPSGYYTYSECELCGTEVSWWHENGLGYDDMLIYSYGNSSEGSTIDVFTYNLKVCRDCRSMYKLDWTCGGIVNDLQDELAERADRWLKDWQMNHAETIRTNRAATASKKVKEKRKKIKQLEVELEDIIKDLNGRE